MDNSPSSISFYKQKQSPAREMPRATKFDPLLADFQLRPEKHPMKIAHRAVTARHAPLPPLSPAQIAALVQTIKTDNQSPAVIRVASPNAVNSRPSKKLYRAPLPPLSSVLMTQLEQTIERDKQQSTAWYARYNSPSVALTPTRRAPLPPTVRAADYSA